MWLDADDIRLPEDLQKLTALKKDLLPDIDTVTMKYSASFGEHGKRRSLSQIARWYAKTGNFSLGGKRVKISCLGGCVTPLRSSKCVRRKTQKYHDARRIFHDQRALTLTLSGLGFPAEILGKGDELVESLCWQ